MKKGFKLNRMLSVALCLCLLLSTCVLGTEKALAADEPTFSATAEADEPQDFVVEHDHDGWKVWNEEVVSSQYIASGNYYLENDVTLIKSIYYIEGEVTLCLNGHTLYTGSSTISVDSDATLTLTDCTDAGVITGNTKHLYVNGGTLILENGTITGYKNGQGGAVYMTKGTFLMKGGSISGNDVGYATSVMGGAVYVNGGTFTMEGGTISGNEGCSGGAVFVGGGDFIMKGGSICDNHATATSYNCGGGVYVATGNFILENGTISNNTASSNGGGVYVVSGSFTMTGGEISDNSAASGGGVHVKRDTSGFAMEGGTISGNNATNGGGVYIDDNSTFTMQGGEISDNHADEDGGGVYVKSGTFSASGNPVVAGNTLSDETTESNIGLVNATTYINVIEELTDGAKLGVNRITDVKETPVLTQGYSEYLSDDAGEYFFYDNAESFENCDVGTGPDGEAWFGYNVTYKDTSGNTLEDQFVGYNCTATPIDDNCWSTEIGGAEFDFNTPITENLTLYSDSETILNPMSSQIRFQRNTDGSYANKFDVRTRAKITDEDFAKYIAETNAEASKKITKAGFVYTRYSNNSSNYFSVTDAQKVAQGEIIDEYVDAPVNYIQDTDGYYMFTCIITDIPVKDVQQGVTAYAYICVEDKWYFYNAETTTIFKDLYEANYPKAAKAYGW